MNIKDTEGRTYIYKKIANIVKNNQIVNAQVIVNEVLEEKPKSVNNNIKEILEEIKNVEDFLVPLNNIFFQSLSKNYDENLYQKNINNLKKRINYC